MVRIRETVPALPLFIQEGRAAPWRPWFAWRPVWVRSPAFPYPREQRVWLRWIERRRFHPADWFRPVFDPSWLEYRMPPDINASSSHLADANSKEKKGAADV